MNDNHHYLTVDLGASSGRVIITTVSDTLTLREVHRFTNQPIQQEVLLVWDFEKIFNEVIYGIQKAFEIEPDIESIGIDTWGVDYGYIGKNGLLLRNPICYRDERTLLGETLTKQYFSKEALYALTGIQHLRFNTIYQIAYDLTYEQALLKEADTWLMIPDLIAYYLTGIKRVELTNLSTTSFYNPNQKTIIDTLYHMGFNPDLIPKIIYPGETYGYLKDDLVQQHQLKKVPVVAVCTHDTASAVHSTLVKKEDVYISSGTWSLIGKVLDKPLINQDTYDASYTNEVGYLHQIRFLKNISGFWIKNKIIEAFKLDNIDYRVLDEEIKQSLYFDSIIDLDAPEFELGIDMLDKIKYYCIKTNQETPKTLSQYLALFNYSLVCKYKHHLETLEKLTNIKTKQIIIIGGGSQNDLINQMTADITRLKVIKGDKEATSIGNALVQHESKYVSVKKHDLSEKKYNVFKPKTDLTRIYQKYQSILKERII
jgi:sugar (pentulose or hexulose) kinase